MSPQETTEPASGPQYDFILKNGENRPKKLGLKLPFSNLPKPILIGLAAVFGFFLIIILLSLLGGRGSGTSDKYLRVMARAQEIARVSDLVSAKSASSDTKSLAITVSTSLNSEQNQLGAYLKSAHLKYSSKSLAIYLNKNTDASLNAAAQNNSLDQTYFGYLKTQLSAYQSSIRTAYQSAGQAAKPILYSFLASVQTIMASPQLAAGQ